MKTELHRTHPAERNARREFDVVPVVAVVLVNTSKDSEIDLGLNSAAVARAIREGHAELLRAALRTASERIERQIAESRNREFAKKPAVAVAAEVICNA